MASLCEIALFLLVHIGTAFTARARAPCEKRVAVLWTAHLIPLADELHLGCIPRVTPRLSKENTVSLFSMRAPASNLLLAAPSPSVRPRAICTGSSFSDPHAGVAPRFTLAFDAASLALESDLIPRLFASPYSILIPLKALQLTRNVRRPTSKLHPIVRTISKSKCAPSLSSLPVMYRLWLRQWRNACASCVCGEGEAA